eukprot:gene9340-12585_t
MSDTAEERKKAKEAYVRALEQQRVLNIANVNPSAETDNTSQSHTMSAVEKRNKLLEEKRRIFFEKNKDVNSNSASANDSNNNKGINTESNNTHASVSFNNFNDNDKQYNNGNIYNKNNNETNHNDKFSSVSYNKAEISNEVKSQPGDPFEKAYLKDFASKGFLSEYSYAKSLGMLEISSKPNSSVPVMNINSAINHNGNNNNFGRSPQLNDDRLKINNNNNNNNKYDTNNNKTNIPNPVNYSNPSQNLGAELDRNDKKARQNEYAQQLRSQIAYHESDSFKHNNNNDNNNNQRDNTNSTTAGIANIGGDEAALKMKKHQQQLEYARQLEQQTQFMKQSNMGPPSLPSQTAHPIYQPQQQSIPGRSVEGTGLNSIGMEEDKSAKRARQMEYAKELNQQMTLQQKQSNHIATPPSQYNNGGIASIGIDPNNNDANRIRKVQLQQEYARQLDQQKYNQLDSQSQTSNQYKDNPSAYDHNKFNGNGGDITRIGGIGGIGGGGVDEKARKRDQQMRYANELKQQQMVSNMNDSHNNRSYSTNNNNNNNNGFNPISNNSVNKDEEKAMKKAKQNEYANFLNNQMQNKFQSKPNNSNSHNSSIQNNDYSSNGAGGGNSNGIGMGVMDEKAEKRAKQAEYARALQFQQHQKQTTTSSAISMQNNLKLSPEKAPLSSIIEDPGWVMGPLGLPVRKTLEVGNRQIQKAFNLQQLGSSPPKPAFQPVANDYNSNMISNQIQTNPYQTDFVNQNNYNNSNYDNIYNNNNNNNNNSFDSERNYNQNNMNVLQPQQPSLFNNQNLNNPFSGQVPQELLVMAAAGNLRGKNNEPLDERALKAKALQLQQAKALEEQIRANEQRKLEEKKKLEDEELKEMQRLEKDRIDLAIAFEREKQDKKVKLEEDNKKELAKQIESKKKMKEDEEYRLKEIERKEEERVAREQEKIKRQAEDEIRREANAAQMHIKGAIPVIDQNISNIYHDTNHESIPSNQIIPTFATHTITNFEVINDKKNPPLIQPPISRPHNNNPINSNNVSDDSSFISSPTRVRTAEGMRNRDKSNKSNVFDQAEPVDDLRKVFSRGKEISKGNNIFVNPNDNQDIFNNSNNNNRNNNNKNNSNIFENNDNNNGHRPSSNGRTKRISITTQNDNSNDDIFSTKARSSPHLVKVEDALIQRLQADNQHRKPQSASKTNNDNLTSFSPNRPEKVIHLITKKDDSHLVDPWDHYPDIPRKFPIPAMEYSTIKPVEEFSGERKMSFNNNRLNEPNQDSRSLVNHNNSSYSNNSGNANSNNNGNNGNGNKSYRVGNKSAVHNNQSLDDSMRLDRTLEFESKLMYPDGTIVELSPKKKPPVDNFMSNRLKSISNNDRYAINDNYGNNINNDLFSPAEVGHAQEAE